MGNPEEPQQPAEKSEPSKEKETFRFPPITDKTLCFQLQGSGDVWMGFNPAKFPRTVILAWCAFQIENFFADFTRRVQEMREKSQGKAKKSLREIMSGGLLH